MAMTRCTWPRPANDEKSVAVLFRVEGDGSKVRTTLRPPPGMLVQFAPKGSYRLGHAIEYYDWILEGRVPREDGEP
eukprot:359759-Alexandrium_andersonii.AAC.1